MKIKLFNLLIIYFSSNLISFSQTPANDKNWNNTPSFSDEFNSFDDNTWYKHLGWGRTTNDWDFTFEDANVYIDNGKLILKADYHSGDSKPIHSGAITTKNSNFLYGYFEIRCKLNSLGIEYMPAFWVWDSYNCDCNSTLNPHCDWNNEIDFFEAFAESSSDLTNITVSSNMHWRNNGCTTYSYFDGTFKKNNVTNSFHTYGYEWSPDFIIFYFDGSPYRFLRNNHVANHSLRLVANLGFRGRPNTYPTFPGYMEIDWIKVYSLNVDDSSSDVNICQFNPSTFNYSVKKSITIGGSGCSSSLSQNDNVTLRAVDFILINGDFTVPLNSELTILPTGGL